ncbi:MAG: hypothetical protein JXB45_11550 [Candidatus Krumholzibacteriota bacterium]|nr:hypothetical protein [Candidatus Krumholzibacteriota bacterium]
MKDGRVGKKTGKETAAPVASPFSDKPADIDKYYDDLAEALNRLPNSFPRTASNIELLLLRKIFSPAEARLAAQMTIEKEGAAEIAARTGLPPREARERLIAMARRERQAHS